MPPVAGGVCAGVRRLRLDELHITLTLSALDEDELMEVLTLAWRMAQPKPRRSQNKGRGEGE